ncbi:MAG: hypothetical protein MK538_12005 [Planctomycetes bacterium]|nr:hypothetical protein [Planctomycetota bacterium]
MVPFLDQLDEIVRQCGASLPLNFVVLSGEEFVDGFESPQDFFADFLEDRVCLGVGGSRIGWTLRERLRERRK